MNRLKVFDGVPPPYDKVSYYVTANHDLSDFASFSNLT